MWKNKINRLVFSIWHIICTLFNKRYNTKNLILYDKVSIYKFYENSKDCIPFCKTIIKDFIELIQFLNDYKKDNKEIYKKIDIKIAEKTKISEIVEKLKDIFSNNNFKNIFEKNDGLTIDKTSEIL